MTNLMTKIVFDFPPPQQRRGYYWKAAESARREEAQSLVELALLMPLFILLLVGSAEFAQFAWAAVLTSNAARAGASFGAQNPANSVKTAEIKAAAAADAASVNLTGLVTTPGLSCVCSNGNSIQDCSAALDDCPTPAIITSYVHVNTTSTVSIFGHSFTATGESIMVVAP